MLGKLNSSKSKNNEKIDSQDPNNENFIGRLQNDEKVLSQDGKTMSDNNIQQNKMKELDELNYECANVLDENKIILLEKELEFLRIKSELFKINNELEGKYNALLQEHHQSLDDHNAFYKEAKMALSEAARQLEDLPKQLMPKFMELVKQQGATLKESYEKIINSHIEENNRLLKENNILSSQLEDAEFRLFDIEQEKTTRVTPMDEPAESSNNRFKPKSETNEFTAESTIQKVAAEHFVLVEQVFNEAQFANSMSEILTESMANVTSKTVNDTRNPTLITEQKTEGYNPRTEQWEHTYLGKVSRIIEGSRTARVPASDGSDYATAYAETIIRRSQSQSLQLLEDMLLKPYFGRVDLETKEYGQETFYIGTHGLEGYIINWQADVAKAYFYRTVGTPIQLEKMGAVTVDFIRQIDITKGKIVQLHDPITANFIKDEALIHALSQKRGLEMKEIVATLQREQYEMVTLPITKPIIVQGSAGSGKSAIALHRLSYLLYKYKNLKEDSVAFIAPNEAFLKHIKNVLPSLGNYKVKQITFINWACSILGIAPDLITRHNSTETSISKYKGSLLFKAMVEKVVHRYINDLRIWSVPFEVEQIKIPVLPVLREIQSKLYLSVRERENEYYNYYYKYWRKQYEHEIAHQERLEQWIKQRSEELCASMSISLEVNKNFLLTDEITNLAREYQLIDDKEEKNTKRKVSVELIKLLVNEVLQQQRLTILKGVLSIDTKEIVEQIWSKYSYEMVMDESERFILYHVNNYKEAVLNMDTILNADKYKSQLDLLQERTHNTILTKQEHFYLEHHQQISEAISTHTLYLFERELLKRVNKGVIIHFKNSYLRIEAQHKAYSLRNKLVLSVDEIDKAVLIIKKHVKSKLMTLCYDGAYQKIIAQAEMEGHIKKTPHTSDSLRFYVEDLAALLHSYTLINGEPKDHMLTHLILDEAQDYMPYEITQMNALTTSKGIMLIGDLGQNLNPASTLNSWQSLYDIIGEPELYELKATYRSTGEIVAVSNKIIEPFAKGKYQLSTQTMTEGEPVEWIPVTKKEEANRIVSLLEELFAAKQNETVAIIIKEESLLQQYENWISPHYSVEVQTVYNLPEDAKVILTTPMLAKGLEFNTVVLARFEDYLPNDFDRKLAYVAASRAIKHLYIIFDKSKPLLVTK